MQCDCFPLKHPETGPNAPRPDSPGSAGSAGSAVSSRRALVDLVSFNSALYASIRAGVLGLGWIGRGIFLGLEEMGEG